MAKVELSDEEKSSLTPLARSRSRGAGLVRRAQIIVPALEGLSAPAMAAKRELCGPTVRFSLKRFNERGLQGLQEDMRSGRPVTSSPQERSTVIRLALTRPAELHLPFACWTLDRRVASLSEHGIGMRRRRLSELSGVLAESEPDPELVFLVSNKMPDLIDLHHDHPSRTWLRLCRSRLSILADPSLDRGRDNGLPKGDGLQRESAQVEQDGLGSHVVFLAILLNLVALQAGLPSAFLAFPFRHTACRTILDQAITTTIGALLHRYASSCPQSVSIFGYDYPACHCLSKTLLGFEGEVGMALVVSITAVSETLLLLSFVRKLGYSDARPQLHLTKGAPDVGQIAQRCDHGPTGKPPKSEYVLDLGQCKHASDVLKYATKW